MTLSGLPLSTKIACVITSRQLTSEPAADWPSVRKHHRAAAAALLLVEVHLAILELRDAQRDGTAAFAGELLDAREFTPQPRGILHLRGDLLGRFGVAVQQVADDVLHLLDQVPADLGVAELVLGLRLEYRVLQPDRQSADEPLAHIVAVVLLLREIVDRLQDALAEGAQVRAAVTRVLAVDERVMRFVEALGVREREFKRFLAVIAAAA